MAISFPTPNLGDPSTLTTTQAGITWTWNDTLQVWSTEGGAGGGASVSVGQTPPTPQSDGDLWWADSDVDEGGGRLYIYTGTEWVDASLPGGGGFSGDYEDLSNKPPLFNLDDGSYENNIITWLTKGGVKEWTTTGNGGVSEGTRNYSYVSQPTTVVTGNGNGGLTVGYRKKPDGLFDNIIVNNPGAGYESGDTFSFVVPVTGVTITATVSTITDAEVDGWYVQPGEDYFVSANKSESYIGVPTFSNGVSIGQNTDFNEEQYSLGSYFHGPVQGRAHAAGYIAGASIQYNGYTTGQYVINKWNTKNFDTAVLQSSISLTASNTITLNTFDSNGENGRVNLRCEADGTLNSSPTYSNESTQANNYLRITNSGGIQRSTSSKRYKDNIRDLTLTNAEALNIVDALQPRLWEDHRSGETVAGLVAEEVFAVAGEHFVSFSPWSQEQTFTELDDAGSEVATTSTVYPMVGNGETPVTKDGGALTDDSEVVDGLNDRALLLAVLKSIQELKDITESLSSRIDTLEGN